MHFLRWLNSKLSSYRSKSLDAFSNFKSWSVFTWPRRIAHASQSISSQFQARLVSWRERRRNLAEDDHSYILPPQSYSGSRARHFLVHVPKSAILKKPRPLVIVLHGCRQDHHDIKSISDFNRIADRHGFLVAYPFITSYRGLRFENCWGWWLDREIRAGSGEVEDLWQIVENIKSNYAVNENRIHVTGLSSGAGMAVAMMVAHADKIASGCAVAGVPYSEKPEAVQHAFNRSASNEPVEKIVREMDQEMGNSKRAVPIKIVHSADDETVDIQSAKNLRDSWGQCFNIDTQLAVNESKGQSGDTDWERSQYRDKDGQPLIETLFLEGPGHGWYGGKPGDYSYPDAPDISQMIWKFFKSHPLPRQNSR